MKTKILLMIAEQLLDENKRKKLIIGLCISFGVFFFILIIPVAILNALNPFNTNASYTAEERAMVKDDPYVKALNHIREVEETENIVLNLDFIRALESVAIYTSDTHSSLEEAKQEEIEVRMRQYYLSLDEKEEVRENYDASVGSVEQATVKVKLYSSKTPEEVFDSMKIDYPLLQSQEKIDEIYALIDFQKNITNRSYLVGDVLPVARECFVYYEPFGQYIEGGEHYGVDLAGHIGTPLYSVGVGEIITVIDGFENLPSGYVDQSKMKEANIVILKTVIAGEEYKIIYGHLSPTIANYVKVGDKVERGQQIGQMGNSGWTSGPHLHFEMRKMGDNSLVDPIEFFELGNLRDYSQYKGCPVPL